MFEVLIAQDEIIIQPADLGDFGYSVEQGFKSRYLNRVVSQEAGICVAIKNIRVIDKIVVQGEGTVQCKVSKSKQ